MSNKFDKSIYIGDKFPSLFRHFDRTFQLFPDARHLYIVRNPLSVIESYDVRHSNPNDSWSHSWQDGLDAWNESVGKVASLPPERLKNFIIVQYEELYKSTEAMNAMFHSLGLAPVDDSKLQSFVTKFASLNEIPVPRRDDLRLPGAAHSNWDSCRKAARIHIEMAKRMRLNFAELSHAS